MYKNNMKYMFFLSLLSVGASIIASDPASDSESAIQQGRVTKAKNNNDQGNAWPFNSPNRRLIIIATQVLCDLEKQRKQQQSAPWPAILRRPNNNTTRKKTEAPVMQEAPVMAKPWPAILRKPSKDK